MKQTLWVMTLLVLACSSANAALLSRSGGQAYYDTDTDLTWVADANLAQTSGYDADGLMDWNASVGWIAALNAQNAGLGYLGTNDWRLPTVTDTGDSGCDAAYTGTDCGFNVDLATGEMARMFYGTLGNSGAYDTSGIAQPCSGAGPNFCLTNTGPFSNLQPLDYWSGTEFAPDTSGAWGFNFQIGEQASYVKAGNEFHAWAVRPGDIGMAVDSDADGIVDTLDNCPAIANSDQSNTDGDARGNVCDNCSAVANTEAGTVPNSPGVLKFQLDADQDGYGNICDGDLNNTNLTTAQDNVILRNQLNQPYNASANAAKSDLNGSGLVTAQDNVILRNQLNTAPGPSGYGCGQPAGSVACP